MENNQYTYTQPPMGQMMPPQMNAPRPHGWRERWMQRFGMDVVAAPMLKGEMTIPNWITGKSIVFFFVAMFACWGAFGYVPGFDLWIVAAISVVLFLYGGQALSKQWSHTKEKHFVQNIFVAGCVVRLLWVLYCYFFFYPEHYGDSIGEKADVEWYVPYGRAIAQWAIDGFNVPFSKVMTSWGGGVDDVGYPVWLGGIYLIFGVECDVIIPYLLKIIIGSYCSISIYRVAKRHFGEGAARMAAIFVCVNPNMIYWCGTMMKEAEMVFLVCLAVDNLDRVLSSGQKYTFRNLLPGISAAIALFFFRSVLGILIFAAFFAHIVGASQRMMSTGKKIIAGVLVATILAISMGERIRTQSKELLEAAQSKERQEENLDFRANREGGNSFAKYAGTAVFAPLIFTIPFPTFNAAQESQLAQIQLSGGSYIKNVLSFFVLLVMLMMLISGEWRRHVFILAYTVGYHIVLVMSNFAHSGRFHMPVWPMIMLFAAYGVQIAKTNVKMRKWFPIALVVEVAICLFWNWYKLKGRGMI